MYIHGIEISILITLTPHKCFCLYLFQSYNTFYNHNYDHCIMWWSANKMTAIFNWCKIDYCPCHYTCMVLKFQSWLFWHVIHVSIFNCSKVMMHNVIICKSHGGHLGFMQMRPLSSLYRPTWLHIIANSFLVIDIPYSFVYLYLFQSYWQSCGGHLVFIQIGPLMKKDFCSPQTKITDFYKESLSQISWVYTNIHTLVKEFVD